MRKTSCALLLSLITIFPSMAAGQSGRDDLSDQPGAIRAFVDGLTNTHAGLRFAALDKLDGDFSNDGIDDLIAMIWYFEQNSVSVETLVLQGLGGGEYTYLGRVEGIFGENPRDAVFEPGRVTFTTSVAGPDDPRCCPSTPQVNIIDVSAMLGARSEK